MTLIENSILKVKIVAMLQYVVAISQGYMLLYVLHDESVDRNKGSLRSAALSLFLHSLDIAHCHSVLEYFKYVWASECTRLAFHAATARMHVRMVM